MTLSEATPEDLKAFAAFFRIVKNYLKMKELLITLIICLASIKSNGQMGTDTTGKWHTGKKLWMLADTSYKYSLRMNDWKPASLIFLRDQNQSAIVNAGSDTLIISDTVLHIYDFKIRYIKIGDKVYPLKP